MPHQRRPTSVRASTTEHTEHTEIDQERPRQRDPGGAKLSLEYQLAHTGFSFRVFRVFRGSSLSRLSRWVSRPVRRAQIEQELLFRDCSYTLCAPSRFKIQPNWPPFTAGSGFRNAMNHVKHIQHPRVGGVRISDFSKPEEDHSWGWFAPG